VKSSLNPFRKTAYRNKKLLNAANGEMCTFCYIQDGTIVAAHSNLGSDGHGTGLKADDYCIAFLCYDCHLDYDAGRMDQEAFHKCMKRTWRQLLDREVLK